MKIVTYATHSEGSFEELIHNKYDVEIIVLGTGDTWNGFITRAQAYRDYLDTLPDDEIVVFIDGFDSRVLKSTKDLQNVFESLDSDIVVSKDNELSFTYIRDKTFRSCKNGKTANAGMIMGYVSSLRYLFDAIINYGSKDDQRNLNKVCKYFPKLTIDTDNQIFENIYNKNADFSKSRAFFGQTPGKGPKATVFRSIQTNGPYLIPEIVLLILIVYFLYLHFCV
jgi:hypothetical protein